MNLNILKAERTAARIPRVSGDEPQAKYIAQFQKVYFSPVLSIPRVSGDEPIPINTGRCKHPYSPRERG